MAASSLHRLACAMLVSLAAGSGCTGLSERQCAEADWHQLGYMAGSGCVRSEHFDEHVDRCSQYGIEPNRALYAEGYREGLSTYCTVKSGFREGQAGRAYFGVCPVGQEPQFLRAYRLGRELNELGREIERVL